MLSEEAFVPQSVSSCILDKAHQLPFLTIFTPSPLELVLVNDVAFHPFSDASVLILLLHMFHHLQILPFLLGVFLGVHSFSAT